MSGIRANAADAETAKNRFLVETGQEKNWCRMTGDAAAGGHVGVLETQVRVSVTPGEVLGKIPLEASL